LTLRMAFTPSPITLCTALEGGRCAGPVASDSRVFFHDLFQHPFNAAHGRFKKVLKNLAFLSYRRACTRVLLSIMEICSIIVIIRSRLLIHHPDTTTLQDAPNKHLKTNILTGTARHIQA